MLASVRSEWPESHFHLQSWWFGIAEAHLALYEGRGREAWYILCRVWPQLRRSLLLGGEFHRVEARWLRARAALGFAAECPPLADELLATAEQQCRSIERDGAPWGVAVAMTVRASIARQRGDAGLAERLLAEATPLLEARSLDAMVAVTRRARGLMLTGEAAGDELARSEAFMSEQQIAEPQRFAAMYLPGC